MLSQYQHTVTRMLRLPHQEIEVEDMYIRALDASSWEELEEVETTPCVHPPQLVTLRSFMVSIGGEDTIPRRRRVLRKIRAFERYRGVKVLHHIKHGNHPRGYISVDIAPLREIGHPLIDATWPIPTP